MYKMNAGSGNVTTEGNFNKKTTDLVSKFKNAYLDQGGDIKNLSQVTKMVFKEGKVTPEGKRVFDDVMKKSKK